MKSTLHNLQRLTEELGESMRMTAVAAGTSCSASCYGCCHQLIHISLVEGVQVAWWLYEHDRVGLDLHERLTESIQNTISKDGGWKDPESYFREAHPCVFLVKKGKRRRCSIYAGRPLTCRAYFVKTDPAWCSPNAEGAGRILFQDTAPWASQATEVAQIVEKELGLPESMIGSAGPIAAMVFTGLCILSKGPEATATLLTSSEQGGSVSP